jgi:hypothetical protein
MADREHGWFRGEGGAVWRMDLPLAEVVADQVKKGALVRVNKDGSLWQEPSEAEPSEAEPQRLTPKQRLQADAVALGLSDEGTVEEITARIAELADLRKQAADLGVEGADTLPPAELAAAVDAALAAK